MATDCLPGEVLNSARMQGRQSRSIWCKWYSLCRLPHLLIMNNGPTSSWSLEVETHPTFSCIQSLFVRAPGNDSHAAARGPLEKTQVFQMSTFPDKRQGSPIFQLYCRSTILSSCFIQWVVVLSLSLVCLSLARDGWLAQVFFSWRCTTSAAVPFWSFRAIEPANTSRPSCYQSVVLLHWITL